MSLGSLIGRSTHRRPPASPRPVKTDTGCRPDTLYGPWSVEPTRFAAMLDAVRGCNLQAVQAATKLEAAESRPPYTTSPDGIATIPISGPMTKYQTSFQSLLGGASTVQTRNALRLAVRDPDVKAILLHIDSPGGTVAGTGDLADAVAQADSRRPTYAYIEDQGASAAYRVAARARKVYANASAEVGSIGTFAVLRDTSGAYAKEGVAVEVISAGKYKGMGTDGKPITDDEREETQRRVDAINEQFLADVSAGRAKAGLTPARVRELADGRVHMAQAAKELGLIDSVASLDQAMREVRDAMEEQELTQELEQAQTKLAEETARNATLAADMAQLRSALAAIEQERRLDDMRQKVEGLKNLPAIAELAQALVAIQGAAPDAYAVLDRQLSAWNEQVKTAALFEEKGSSATGNGKPDLSNLPPAERFKQMAQALVDEGKHKNLADAMTAVAKEHPELMRREGVK